MDLLGQDPSALDVASLRQSIVADKEKTERADATPRPATAEKSDSYDELFLRKMDRDKAEAEVRAAKAREGGPRRFAADLFDVREPLWTGTEGGISEDYVLGTGDELQVNAFGSVTFELPARVDGRGEVLIPKVGTVKVAGLTLDKARAAIRSKVARDFSNATVDLSVTKLREVRVFVLGEVYRSGSYVVPSLSSLVNVLGLAGGPTLLGSFRDIRVLRGGRVIHRIDLYQLRAEGLGNLNFALQSGDTLFVPLAFKQVLLEGAFLRVAGRDADLDAGVNRAVDQKAKEQTGPGKNVMDPRPDAPPAAMQFELLPKETAADALKFAGGLLPKAFADALSLRRQDKQGITNVEDVAIDRLASVELQRGDVLSALPRRDRMERIVSVTGWARVPGTFARVDGLRVGDLLKREQQVLPDTYQPRGEVVRTLPDGSTRFLSFSVSKALEGDPEHNLVLENRDRVELFRIERMRLPKEVSLVGPFTSPGTFPLHEGMRVSDLVFRSGVPLKSANRYYAELARSRYGKPSEVRKLDLGKLIATEEQAPLGLRDDASNPLLQEDDQITVYEKPEFRIHKVVRISGQVAKPGSYVLDSEHPTLSQLVDRAGGLMPEAMPEAGIFFRRLGGEGNDPNLNLATGAMGVSEILERLNETKLIDIKTEQKLASLPGAGALTPLFKPPVLHGLGSAKLNRMVVNFRDALKGKREADVELSDGDEVIVPRKTDSAMILGETATPFAFYRIKPGMDVGDLLQLAGGTTRNADTSNIRLLKADGRIIDSWVSHRKLEPGDAVLVPQRIRRDSTWQDNMAALTPLALLLNAIRN